MLIEKFQAGNQAENSLFLSDFSCYFSNFMIFSNFFD